MTETLEKQKQIVTRIKLPTEAEDPTDVVPRRMIVFGLPKCGKTTKLAELPNFLNIDVERGAGFVKVKRVQPPKELGPVGVFNWLKDVAHSIKEANYPYDFVAIETASALDEMAEWVGTYNYMHSIQGKKFNREKDEDGEPIVSKFLLPDDPEYQSVHNMGEGYGYKYSRKAMTDIFDTCKDLGRICTIFVCHVTDKMLIAKQTNSEVRAMDLSLTGKLKSIFCADVDAIGYVWNKKGVINISFKGSEERIGGMRGGTHLRGYEGPLDWNLIFKLDEMPKATETK